MSGRHRTARQQSSLGEHAFWTIVIAVAVVTAGLVVWFLAQQSGERPAAATTPRPAPCVWDEQMARTLAERGEDPADWTVTDLDNHRAGEVDLDEDHAYLDRDLGCGYVRAVTLHEWMHLQQGRRYGGTVETYGAYDDTGHLELVADCGVLMLGSTYTPYVDEHMEKTGVGCSPADAAAALELISFRPRAKVSPGLGMVGNTRAWTR